MLYVSPHFQDRTYANKEVKLALDVLDQMPEGKIYLIPARLEDCVVQKRLSERQWVDLYVHDGYQRLVSAMRWDTDNATKDG